MCKIFKIPPFGLDISDYSIEVLELKKKLGKVCLKGYGRVILEKGILEEGEILDREKLKEKVKEALEKTIPERIKTDKVIVSLPESKTFIHFFKTAGKNDFKKQDSRELIRKEAEKIFPFDLKNFYYDINKGLFAAAPKKIVNEYLETLRELKLRPVAIDIESASLVRAFGKEIINEEAVLIIDIGARNTVLTIADKDSIKLSVLIPLAGNHFTETIKDNLKVSFEKAEELKKECGLDPQKEEGKVMLVLQKVFQDILTEIRKAISFYKEKNGREIKKILLCGGSAFLPKMDSYIASNLNFTVKIPDPWTGINVESLFRKKEFQKIIKTKFHPVFFANVIGLAERGLEKDPGREGINLIPQPERVKPLFIGEKLSRSKTFSFIMVCFTMTAFIFLMWVIYAYILKGR